MTQEQNRAGSNLPTRGRSQKSEELTDAMFEICEETQPITGRGVGYKLFTRGLIPSMHKQEMAKVYRLLRIAREMETIPWEWIVDENRELERNAGWDDPEQFARVYGNHYRRDFWNMQPKRCEVWSEKGTVRGMLAPTLDSYGVGFRVMHGFTSAGSIYDVAQDDDGRPLVVLYVGDWDPSGMWMSEKDLPGRLAKYGRDHVEFRRIALTKDQLVGLPSFPAADKKKDPRHKWFVRAFGSKCWELDAMDPNDLRFCVENTILDEIEPEAWGRCADVNDAEQESLRKALNKWAAAKRGEART